MHDIPPRTAVSIDFYVLQECVEEPDLQLQSYGISMTQGNNKISERNYNDVPVLIL